MDRTKELFKIQVPIIVATTLHSCGSIQDAVRKAIEVVHEIDRQVDGEYPTEGGEQ